MATWCQRLHDHGGLSSDSHDPLADLRAGEWLPDDQVPPTVCRMLKVFFTEMWPMLQSTCVAVTDYIELEHPTELPGKSSLRA